MIVDLNITEYIRSLMKEEKNDLSHIESEARVNHVPIVKPETKELLRTLVLLKKPMKGTQRRNLWRSQMLIYKY